MSTKDFTVIKEFKTCANGKCLKDIKKFSHQFISEYTCDEGKIFEFLICVDELFCNSIIHGYEGLDGKVKIKFLKNQNYLAVNIEDFGKGMPKPYKRKTIKNSELGDSGRGLLIVNNIADKVTIKSSDNKGTNITIFFERV